MATAALGIVFLAMSASAHAECQSPSDVVGATATTVYRCPDDTQPAAKQPLGETEKSTEVQRGSAEVPWFEPAPGKADNKAAEQQPEERKADPVTQKPASETAKGAPEQLKTKDAAEETKTEAAKAAPEQVEAEPAPQKTEIKAAKAAPDDQVEDNIAPKRKQLKAKVPSKKKLARKKIKKIKVAKPKKAKVKEVAETPPAKITSPPPDDKTILITKKDMSLGARIGNWLGL